MIDPSALGDAQHTIQVQPSDQIFVELGNNTYDFKDLVSELIDNAIAARRPDRMLTLSLDLAIDADGKPVSLRVTDNASGIPLNSLNDAISPAAIQTKGSLNEHGLGMKQAIAGLGRLDYIATKVADSPRALVIREFKFGDVAVFEADFAQDSGTEIFIDQLRPIVNAHPTSITTTLVPYLGARYRGFLRVENPAMELTVLVTNAANHDVLYSWTVEEIKPTYFHPSTRKNQPVITSKALTGDGWRARLTFGYAPTDEEQAELGLDVPPQHHPYKVSLSKQGLDILLYDRVVLFHQLPELGLVQSRHNDFNLIRGEIHLLEGFTTAITKNFIIYDEPFKECIREVRRALTNEDQEGPNYLQQKRYPDALPEKLLRDRLKNWLENNPLKKVAKAQIEYAVEGLDGNIDVLADGQAIEIKRDQANGLDVYQLFAYMDMGDISEGMLVAASFSPGAEAAASFVNKNHPKNIQLAKLGDFPINHHPSEDERAAYY